jgi:hypothetical protein
MNAANKLAILMAIESGLDNSYDGKEFEFRRKEPKPFKKCLRKGCNNMTSHNGGYCNAECCKENRYPPRATQENYGFNKKQGEIK